MKYLIISIICTFLLSCKLDSKKTSKPTSQIDSTERALKIFENRKRILSSINESDTLSVYGSQVYRFILVSPFNPLILFRLVSSDSSLILTTKQFYIKQPDGQGSDTLLNLNEIKLSESDAIIFTKEFYNSMFWNLKSDGKVCMLDATYWDIEAFDKFETNSSGYNHIALYYRKMGPIWKIYNTLLNVSEIKLN
jgi:hypothetical protein